MHLTWTVVEMSSDLLFKKEGMSDLQQYPKNLLMENVEDIAEKPHLKQKKFIFCS